MLIEKLSPDFHHEDDRGSLVQLARRGYSQVNVISSKAGALRGGHYHRLNTEAFYVISGRCRVVAKLNEEEEVEEFSSGDFFRIAPNVVHDFEFVEDTALVSMYSLGVELDDGSMDIHDPTGHPLC